MSSMWGANVFFLTCFNTIIVRKIQAKSIYSAAFLYERNNETLGQTQARLGGFRMESNLEGRINIRTSC